MNYPQWKKSDWSETRFGVTMKDEYIGLEQPKDPAVLNWGAAENALTDQFFSTLPGYAQKKEQLQARPFYASYSAVTETPEAIGRPAPIRTARAHWLSWIKSLKRSGRQI